FKVGLGGRVGSGDQPFPWIHRTDAAWALLFCIENNALEGPVNVVAPQVITNEEFTKAFGDALHRPTIFPVPEFGLELVYGEGAGVLTSGQKVVPRKLKDAGFEWRHPTIQEALNTSVQTA
ncbi:MAG: DUF1731 domain-containing protein, partial [Euryarchaeota archaeon]|nr:DUF1731 domain-containing protein [Euryarchaeota archaeon]